MIIVQKANNKTYNKIIIKIIMNKNILLTSSLNNQINNNKITKINKFINS